MSKYLFIVESPNKCGKIKSFLGPDYTVTASVGHVREIPKKGMNIDFKGGTFEPIYQISNDKKDVVKNIKEEAKKAEKIFLATDLDREGEAISYSIYDMLDKASQKKCKRIAFTEITKKAIDAALANPRDIDMNMVNAAKARQVLDRIVGYCVSPVLWYTAGISGSSAGRVQSVGLKIVCDRQKEIDAFKPEDYWFIEAVLACKKGEFMSKVVTKDKDNKYTVEKVAQDDLEALKKATYAINKIDRAEKRNNPNPPFDTNSLQVSCSNVFGWSLSKSQTIAQKLYEAGKCFLPGTKILMASGEILDVSNVSKLAKDWTEEILSVDSLTLSSKVVKAIPVTLSHNGKVNILKTSSDIIKVTDDHIFPVFDSNEGKIIEKRAKDIIEKTDYFLTKQENIRSKIKSKKYSIIDLLKLSNKNHDKFLFRFNKGFYDGIEEIKNILMTDYKVKESTYYKYRRLETIPFSILCKLIEKKIISMNYIEQNYNCLQYACPSSKPIKMPFWLDEKICYLAGVVSSDGHMRGSKICLQALLDKNPNGIDIGKYVDIKKQINDFMMDLGFDSSKNIQYSNNIMVEILNILKVPSGSKSSLIDFSNIILTSGSNNVRAFIAGLFDGDGYFTFNKIKGKNVSIQAGYTSKSNAIIRNMRLVLSQFGINTEIHEDNRTKVSTIKVSIYDVAKLAALICPFSKIKTKVYDSIFINRNNKSNSRSPYNKPIIKAIELERQRVGITKENLSRISGFDYWAYFSHGSLVPQEACRKFAKILNSDLLEILSSVSYEQIQSNIQEDYIGEVYCVQSDNNYLLVENCIVSHNCTYIRTDSFNISAEAMDEVRKHIKDTESAAYLPASPQVYTKKSGAAAQEAHEAIRPTHVSDNGDNIDENDEKKMYKLIRDRFIASQMTQQIINTVVYDIKASTGHTLIARGQTIKFDGWAKVYKYSKTKDEVLPEADDKESLTLKKIDKTKHTTQPPARYNEGSLAKAMEKEGVGRPATRASIITSIQKKGYVGKEKGAKGLVATILGMRICDFLQPNFKDFFMDIKYTSTLEEELDEIANGKKTYIEVVKTVYDILKKHIKDIEKNSPEKNKGDKNMGAKCPVCGEGEVVEKAGRFGKFLTCSAYPKCKSTFVQADDGTFKIKEKKEVKSTGRKCPDCAKAGRDGEMLERKNKSTGSVFYGCSKWPACKHSEKGEGDTSSPKKYTKKPVVKEEDTSTDDGGGLDLSIDGDNE